MINPRVDQGNAGASGKVSVAAPLRWRNAGDYVGNLHFTVKIYEQCPARIVYCSLPGSWNKLRYYVIAIDGNPRAKRYNAVCPEAFSPVIDERVAVAGYPDVPVSNRAYLSANNILTPKARDRGYRD